MLYHLLPDLADVYNVFNVFRYITFRAAGALVTSLVLAFVLGPMTIRGLKRFRIGQVVRADGPVLVDLRLATEENVYPMVPPGAALDEMVGGLA